VKRPLSSKATKDGMGLYKANGIDHVRWLFVELVESDRRRWSKAVNTKRKRERLLAFTCQCNNNLLAHCWMVGSYKLSPMYPSLLCL